MIRLTDIARSKFHEIAEAEDRKGDGLRVRVQHGGSPKPEFALDFVAPNETAEDDRIVEDGDVKFFLDPESAKWLEGATVDFVDQLGESGFRVDAPNAGVRKPEGPLAEAVGRLLVEKINPQVASHGGWVSLIAIEDDTAYLQFGGGCQGCGMINVTLKQGVEKILFAEIPELKKVMDVTDHASGTNPYYQPAK